MLSTTTEIRFLSFLAEKRACIDYLDTDAGVPCLSSHMEFTDAEKLWLQSISVEVPKGGDLTPQEEHYRELAKPQTDLESVTFQIMASVRFGLADLGLQDTTEPKKSGYQERSIVSCG